MKDPKIPLSPFKRVPSLGMHFEVSRSPVDSSTAWAELGTELGTVLGTELGTEVGGPWLRHNYTGQWSPRHQW